MLIPQITFFKDFTAISGGKEVTKRAVNELYLSIERGEVFGMLGPNGAGKTTIFNVIAGAMKPDTGGVQFQGTDITGQPAHKLFHLGIMRTFQIPQEFFAYHFSH